MYLPKYRLELKESNIHLTESEKQDIKDKITVVKQVVKENPKKIHSQLDKKRTQYDSKIKQSKQILLKNKIDVKQLPDIKSYNVDNDYSIKGIFKTLMQWVNDTIKNLDIKTITTTIIIAILWSGVGIITTIAIDKLLFNLPFIQSIGKYNFRKFPGDPNLNLPSGEEMLNNYDQYSILDRMAIDKGLTSIIQSFLTTCIIAPIAEEITKYIAKKFNKTKEWNTAFNTFEYSEYCFWGTSPHQISAPSPFMRPFIYNIATLGFGKALMYLPGILFFRIFAVFMHTTTSKIISDDKSVIKSPALRTLIGILIHVCWNSLAMFWPFSFGGAIVQTVLALSTSVALTRIFTWAYQKLFSRKGDSTEQLQNYNTSPV